MENVNDKHEQALELIAGAIWSKRTHTMEQIDRKGNEFGDLKVVKEIASKDSFEGRSIRVLLNPEKNGPNQRRTQTRLLS
jgi:hypothetical protein